MDAYGIIDFLVQGNRGVPLKNPNELKWDNQFVQSIGSPGSSLLRAVSMKFEIDN